MAGARHPAPVARTGAGGWSTGRHLPIGALVDRRDGRGWCWQIEHNGPWHWQVGEYRGGLYLSLLGPTDAEHQWRQVLAPGDSFETVSNKGEKLTVTRVAYTPLSMPK